MKKAALAISVVVKDDEKAPEGKIFLVSHMQETNKMDNEEKVAMAFSDVLDCLFAAGVITDPNAIIEQAIEDIKSEKLN